MTRFNWPSGQAYLLLTLAAIIWGANAVAGKMAVGHVSPFLLTTLRWAGAMVIILPFALPHLKRDWPLIRKHFWFLAFLGALGFTTFNNLLYTSLNYTTAINASIIQAAMPLIVFLLNFVLFRIRATALQVTGFGLTVIGIIIIAARGSIETLTALAFNYGDVLMLIAISAYGAYSVLLRQVPALHWMSFIAVLGTSAMVTSTGFSAWEFSSGNGVMPDATGWAIVLFTAVFPSIISQVFWRQGLIAIGSNRGGVFMNMVPIFGAALAILILGERFEAFHAVALVLVLGGVWLSQR